MSQMQDGFADKKKKVLAVLGIALFVILFVIGATLAIMFTYSLVTVWWQAANAIEVIEYDIQYEKIDYAVLPAATVASVVYLDENFFISNNLSVPKEATLILDRKYADELDECIEDYNQGKYTGVTNRYGYSFYADNTQVKNNFKEDLIFVSFTCDRRLELYEDFDYQNESIIEGYKYAEEDGIFYFKNEYYVLRLQIEVKLAETNNLSQQSKEEIVSRTKEEIIESMAENIIHFTEDMSLTSA